MLAVWVPLLSMVAGSLLFGNFLATGFFLSLSGAVCSLLVLAFVQHLPALWSGAVSHSIYAAFAHITGQIVAVYLWLIQHAGIAYLIPIFATATSVLGTVSWLIVARFMDNTTQQPPSPSRVTSDLAGVVGQPGRLARSYIRWLGWGKHSVLMRI